MDKDHFAKAMTSLRSGRLPTDSVPNRPRRKRATARAKAFQDAIERLERRAKLGESCLDELRAFGMSETAAVVVDQVAIVRLCIADIRSLAAGD